MSGLFDNIFAVADTLGPLLLGAEGSRYIAAAQAAVKLIEGVKPLADQVTGHQLEVTRDQLDATIARVNAHADQTIDKLKG